MTRTPRSCPHRRDRKRSGTSYGNAALRCGWSRRPGCVVSVPSIHYPHPTRGALELSGVARPRCKIPERSALGQAPPGAKLRASLNPPLSGLGSGTAPGPSLCPQTPSRSKAPGGTWRGSVSTWPCFGTRHRKSDFLSQDDVFVVATFAPALQR